MLKKVRIKQMTTVFLLLLFIALGIIIVFYFSWISSPRFEYNYFVPKRIAVWADQHANDNLRTAVPFSFIGITLSCFLLIKKYALKIWGVAWIAIVFIVFVAEIGQLKLPLRSFDWKDVYWGAIGSLLPMLFMYIIAFWYKNRIKI